MPYIYRANENVARTKPAPYVIQEEPRPEPRPRTLPAFDPTLCGTMPGYRQHRLHGQKQCTKCNGAQSKYLSEWRGKE